jgi:dipeptidyl aminopeptidase/acylaminoacyl peptidase
VRDALIRAKIRRCCCVDPLQLATHYIRERSVMNWPDQVTAPVLIIHGTHDQEVPATEALTFATKLAHLGKRYQLMVYADDVHEVAKNRQDRDASIGAWFTQHALVPGNR